MKTAISTALVITAGLAMAQYSVMPVKADPEDKITICHGAGRDGTTHFETLTLSRNAVYQDQGQGGHFYENGTPKAGHEQDYLGECRSTASPSPSASVTPSTSPSVTPSPSASNTPAPSNNNSNNDSGSNNSNSNNSSSGDNSGGEVLGAYAGTGVVTDAIMNAVGAMGGLMTTAGSILYGKKKRTQA